MNRDFQLYNNEIISYSHNGDTLTLFCMFGNDEKWRTQFRHVRSVKGKDNLVGNRIAFFGRDISRDTYTLFFQDSNDTAVVRTSDHWHRLPGWK